MVSISVVSISVVSISLVSISVVNVSMLDMQCAHGDGEAAVVRISLECALVVKYL